MRKRRHEPIKLFLYRLVVHLSVESQTLAHAHPQHEVAYVINIFTAVYQNGLDSEDLLSHQLFPRHWEPQVISFVSLSNPVQYEQYVCFSSPLQ